MVASQLASRGIQDCRVLAAMAWVPREWFLPPHLAREAYEDAPLPIGSGQTISQPLIVALMTEALAPRRRDRVLEIGTGSGYQTARSGRAGGATRRRRAVRAPHLPARVHGGALDVTRLPDDLLGAHVSTQGGVAEAPARGSAIRATAIQVFTKTPNQWREPTVRDADVAAFRTALAASDIRAVVSHDSYLINLASPDEALRERSVAAFTGELVRCRALGIPWVVSHPGNYIDDRAEGLARNARAYAQCLTAVARSEERRVGK